MIWKKSNKTSTPRKRINREKFSLVRIFSVIVLLSTLTVATATGSYAMWILRDSKLADLQTVLFLQLDFEARRISSAITARMERRRIAAQNNPKNTQPLADVPAAIPAVGLSALPNLLPKDFPLLKELDLEDFDTLPKWTLLKKGTKLYIVERRELLVSKENTFTSRRLVFWQVNMPLLADALLRAKDRDVLVYIVSREGQVLESSDAKLDEKNILERDIVRRFIQGSLRSGQVAITTPEGDRAFGFHSEIPGTNLVLFSETPATRAMADVSEWQKKFLWVFLGMTMIVLLIVQIPLQLVVQPIKELAQLAADIRQNKLGITPQSKGLGELAVLTRTFGAMSRELAYRNKEISGLLAEQRIKIRIASELDIAKRIQDNFLPREALPPQAGITVAARYEAAEEVAGDWYGYAWCEKTGDTIAAIVDVAGHGAGSSMFTAMAAVLFREMLEAPGGLLQVEDFATKLNKWILYFGKQKWHATMQLACYRKARQEIEILNAGHPFPVLLDKGPDHKFSARVQKMPSSPLGLSEVPNIWRLTLPFKDKRGLLMFTDGLSEGRNEARRVYGSKSILRICERSASDSINDVVDGIQKDWQLHVGNAPGRDDFCIMGIQSAS